MAHVAILMQSFNRSALLRQALESLMPAIDEGIIGSILVYDAGSSDGSIESVRQFASSNDDVRTSLLKDPESASFSAGHNILLDHLFKTEANVEFVLFFETDNLLLSPEPVRRAIRILESRPEIDAVGFTSIRHNGSYAGHGCRYPRKAEFLLGQRLSAVLGVNTPVRKYIEDEVFMSDVAYTSPLLVRRSALARVAGFRANKYPFSDSDIDLCLRLQQGGNEKICVVETRDVIHDNDDEPSAWSARRTIDFHRARYQFINDRYGMTVFDKAALALRHFLETALLIPYSTLRPSKAEKVKVRIWLLRNAWRGYIEDLKEVH